MKTLQRLEVFSGFLYLVSVLVYIYFIDMPLSKGIAERSNVEWSYLNDPWVIIGILIHLTVPICAYLHAFRQSYVAFWALCSVGGLVVLAVGLTPFFGSTWPKPNSIFLAPPFFAFVTIVIAGINAIAHLQQKQNLSKR